MDAETTTDDSTTELTEPATGEHTTRGMPHGSTSITPHIVVSRAADALDFYSRVLGARILDVTRFGDAIAHAVLDFGSGMMTISDPIESYGLAAPNPRQGVTYSLALYVPNIDEVTRAAEANGATIREPASTFVTGDRFSSIIDPFGVRWSIMTRVEDISPDESARRVAEWAATHG
ncbi:VOC family protein [Okibacterium endophyticum]